MPSPKAPSVDSFFLNNPNYRFFLNKIIQFYDRHKNNVIERVKNSKITYEQGKHIINRYKNAVLYLAQWATENYKDYEREIASFPPRHINSIFHIRASEGLTSEDINKLYHDDVYNNPSPTLEDLQDLEDKISNKEPKKRKRTATPQSQTEPDIIQSSEPVKLELTPTLFIASVLYYYSVMTESFGDYFRNSKDQIVYTKHNSTYGMYYIDPISGDVLRNKLGFTDFDDQRDGEVVAECVNLLTAHISIKDAEFHESHPQSLRGKPLITLDPLYLKSPTVSPTPPSLPAPHKKQTTMARTTRKPATGGSKRKRTIKKSKPFTRTRKNR
jgi:hypothetical protein